MKKKDNKMFLEDKFLAFAHRGGNEFAPENSFKAFESAVNIGYKYLETDVHLTKDGFLIEKRVLTQKQKIILKGSLK